MSKIMIDGKYVSEENPMPVKVFGAEVQDGSITTEKFAEDAKTPFAGVADSANSVSWDGVEEKPTSFPPATHNHNNLYYTKEEVDSLLQGTIVTHQFDIAQEDLGSNNQYRVNIPVTEGKIAKIIGIRIFGGALVNPTTQQKISIGHLSGDPEALVEFYGITKLEGSEPFHYTPGSDNSTNDYGVEVVGELGSEFSNDVPAVLRYYPGNPDITDSMRIDLIVKEV